MLSKMTQWPQMVECPVSRVGGVYETWMLTEGVSRLTEMTEVMNRTREWKASVLLVALISHGRVALRDGKVSQCLVCLT